MATRQACLDRDTAESPTLADLKVASSGLASYTVVRLGEPSQG